MLQGREHQDQYNRKENVHLETKHQTPGGHA